MKQKEKRVKSLRLTVKNIYQKLTDQDNTIDEADTMLLMLGVEIDRIFNDQKLKTKVSELDIKINQDGKKEKEVLELVKDLTITEAEGLLYGLSEQIKIGLRKENKERKLKEVKIELL